MAMLCRQTSAVPGLAVHALISPSSSPINVPTPLAAVWAINNINTSLLVEPAGLVFYDPQPRSPEHAEASLGLLFALQLVWALFPFMYTAFLQADRQYYATDAANGLYRPSVCSGLLETCEDHTTITLGCLWTLSARIAWTFVLNLQGNRSWRLVRLCVYAGCSRCCHA